MIYTKISNLIRNQFPQFYQDEGEAFIRFVQAYYEWLESSEKPNYHATRLLDYQDIDKSIDRFIGYLKEEYLKGIQFETTSNKKFFIKHSSEFHRAKGTERAVDIFFRLVYGVGADVYLPSNDIFRPSSGEWVKPEYLEVSNSSKLKNFIGKTVTGLDSGASAYVDDYIVRKSKTGTRNVLTVSSIIGRFQPGEIIAYDSDYTSNPKIIGSLYELNIINGGRDFQIGEDVRLISDFGSYAKGVIQETEDVSGLVEFSLSDGGYGYNSNSEVLVSNTILSVSLLSNNSFRQFETVSQNLHSITFKNANANFQVGDDIYRYAANGLNLAVAKIVSANQLSNTSNGTMVVSTLSGNVLSSSATANLFSTANLITSNTLTITNISASANVIGKSDLVKIYTTEVLGSFVPGGNISQGVVTGRIESVTEESSYTVISVSNSSNVFLTGSRVISDTANANVQFYYQKLGLRNLSNTFYRNATVTGGRSNCSGNLVFISTGSGATFSLGPNTSFSHVNVANLNTDFIIDYELTNLNSLAYAFPKYPSGNNSNGTLLQILNFENYTTGTLTNTSIIAINPGENYSEAPIVTIRDRISQSSGKRDYILSLETSGATLYIGEVINQSYANGELIANGAIGLVESVSNNIVNAKRISLSNTFSSSNSYIKGERSGSVLKIQAVDTNMNKKASGINAVILANTISDSGSAKTIRIDNSGLGYIDQEEVIFYSTSTPSKTGSAKTQIIGSGKSIGFYRDSSSEPSGSKKIQDGVYYQPFSYEVQVPVSLDKYEKMFKETIHVAGMKLFHKQIIDSYILSSPSATVEITQS